MRKRKITMTKRMTKRRRHRRRPRNDGLFCGIDMNIKIGPQLLLFLCLDKIHLKASYSITWKKI